MWSPRNGLGIYNNTEFNTDSNGTVVRSFISNIFFEMNCTSRKGLVAVLREAKNKAVDGIKLQTMSYRNVLIVFSGVCNHFITDQIDIILSHIDRGLNNQMICGTFLNMCPSPMLQAPKSRKFIIPADEVFTVDNILAYRPWNSEPLSQKFQEGNSREASDNNMNARLGLISNTRPCTFEDGEAEEEPSLMSLNFVSNAKDRDLFEWRCPKCRREAGDCNTDASFRSSIKFYSFFYRPNLEFKKMIQQMYYWNMHHTATHSAVMEEVGVFRQTVADWYNFFRDVCQETIYRCQTSRLFRGVIEIDESKFFKAKYNRGRMQNRRSGSVFGMIERGSNDVRLFPVERRDAATLLPIIHNNVEAGSPIRGWTYSDRINFVNPENPLVHTEGNGATWEAIKRDMKHFYGTTLEHTLPVYVSKNVQPGKNL